jgi:hypothetical protein
LQVEVVACVGEGEEVEGDVPALVAEVVAGPAGML